MATKEAQLSESSRKALARHLRKSSKATFYRMFWTTFRMMI
jgi:hypothetical protein